MIEFFRGDPRGMVFGNISTSQFISLILVPVSLVMLVYLSRKAESIQPRVREPIKRTS